MTRPLKERGYWDAVASTYDDLYQSDWSRNEDQELEGWLREAVLGRVFVRVLDVGCGTGLGLVLISRILPHFAYHGVDISEGMLARLRAKLESIGTADEVKLYTAYASDLKALFLGHTFDLILFTNAAASYAGVPTRVLRDCKFLLDHDGLVFASFLNRRSLRRCVVNERSAIEMFNTRGAAAEFEGVRVIVPAENELRTRCRRVGLTVRWVRYQNSLNFSTALKSLPHSRS